MVGKDFFTVFMFPAIWFGVAYNNALIVIYIPFFCISFDFNHFIK